jgi:hypothetical protein
METEQFFIWTKNIQVTVFDAASFKELLGSMLASQDPHVGEALNRKVGFPTGKWKVAVKIRLDFVADSNETNELCST